MIVGGGPTGLTLSTLLGKLGVRSLLLERAPALTTHPQAHFVNNRTMEVGAGTCLSQHYGDGCSHLPATASHLLNVGLPCLNPGCPFVIDQHAGKERRYMIHFATLKAGSPDFEHMGLNAGCLS